MAFLLLHLTPLTPNLFNISSTLPRNHKNSIPSRQTDPKEIQILSPTIPPTLIPIKTPPVLLHWKTSKSNNSPLQKEPKTTQITTQAR